MTEVRLLVQFRTLDNLTLSLVEGCMYDFPVLGPNPSLFVEIISLTNVVPVCSKPSKNMGGKLGFLRRSYLFSGKNLSN